MSTAAIIGAGIFVLTGARGGYQGSCTIQPAQSTLAITVLDGCIFLSSFSCLSSASRGCGEASWVSIGLRWGWGLHSTCLAYMKEELCCFPCLNVLATHTPTWWALTGCRGSVAHPQNLLTPWLCVLQLQAWCDCELPHWWHRGNAVRHVSCSAEPGGMCSSALACCTGCWATPCPPTALPWRASDVVPFIPQAACSRGGGGNTPSVVPHHNGVEVPPPLTHTRLDACSTSSRPGPHVCVWPPHPSSRMGHGALVQSGQVAGASAAVTCACVFVFLTQGLHGVCC